MRGLSNRAAAALAAPCSSGRNNIVKDQVTFVKRIISSGDPDRTAAVLVEKVRPNLHVSSVMDDALLCFAHTVILPVFDASFPKPIAERA